LWQRGLQEVELKALLLKQLFYAGILVSAASAQTVTLDEGGFRLLVNGQEAGTETFSIRQNGAGESAVIIAAGRVVLDTARGGHVLNADLQVAGPALRPAAYQVSVEGVTAEKIAGRVVGARFSARIISAAGERMREYLASEGAVVVDEGVAHQYYFLAQRAGSAGGQVPMIIPRQSQQVSAVVSIRGNEAIAVGGNSVAARHLVITIPAGPERHVWVDSQGRVLRLEIPARKFVAERIAAPK
jgi:hypothetical protein